jgi:hypothetical protein
LAYKISRPGHEPKPGLGFGLGIEEVRYIDALSKSISESPHFLGTPDVLGLGDGLGDRGLHGLVEGILQEDSGGVEQWAWTWTIGVCISAAHLAASTA